MRHCYILLLCGYHISALLIKLKYSVGDLGKVERRDEALICIWVISLSKTHSAKSVPSVSGGQGNVPRFHYFTQEKKNTRTVGPLPVRDTGKKCKVWKLT